MAQRPAIGGIQMTASPVSTGLPPATAESIRRVLATGVFGAWSLARELVLIAASEGRATKLAAGSRGNAVAVVLIDGHEAGGAASLCHFVRETPQRATFGEVELLPGYNWQLPARLQSNIPNLLSNKPAGTWKADSIPDRGLVDQVGDLS